MQQWLLTHGIDATIIEYENAGRTAADAAATLNGDVAQITRSIIFKSATNEGSVLVIASGANRVDEMKVATRLNETLTRADASFVREHTGFAIGGVPLIAHAIPGIVLMDEDLLRFDRVFPAGATPHAMFAIDPETLAKLANAQVGSVKVHRV